MLLPFSPVPAEMGGLELNLQLALGDAFSRLRRLVAEERWGEALPFANLSLGMAQGALRAVIRLRSSGAVGPLLPADEVERALLESTLELARHPATASFAELKRRVEQRVAGLPADVARSLADLADGRDAPLLRPFLMQVSEHQSADEVRACREAALGVIARSLLAAVHAEFNVTWEALDGGGVLPATEVLAQLEDQARQLGRALLKGQKRVQAALAGKRWPAAREAARSLAVLVQEQGSAEATASALYVHLPHRGLSPGAHAALRGTYRTSSPLADGKARSAAEGRPHPLSRSHTGTHPLGGAVPGPAERPRSGDPGVLGSRRGDPGRGLVARVR